MRALISAGLGVGATVAGLACGGGSPSSPATIEPASLQGKILFTRAGGHFGDETVYTADADGTNERRITDFARTCCPRWSPDGKTIQMAAMSPDGKRITTGIANPDGSLVRKIPLPKGTLNLGCAQAWSATTGRLACEGWDEADRGSTGVYTLRASDGGDLVRVTRNPHGHDLPMDFSPDGSQIFFLREPATLFVANADGTGVRRVTPADMPVDVVGNAGGRLSPDGTRIVFTSRGTIWAIHPDGSGLKKIFRDGQRRPAITPTWSPDGRFILFGLGPKGSIATVDAAPPNGLYVIRADGTGLTPLIVSPDWKREPDWVAASK